LLFEACEWWSDPYLFRGVKITYKDGTEFDMTSTRVKETEANPYVPGATRPVRYEDALDNKGIKRAPTQQELDWFNNIKW